MNKNILSFSVLSVFLFLTSQVHAQNCPELTGEYVCGQNTSQPFIMRVQQGVVGSTMAYDFASAPEGSHRILADGSQQTVETKFGKGTYSARCNGEHLETIFNLTRNDGVIYQVKDSLRKERKALVRIRLSLPSSQVKVKDVYVCRPYFPPRNRR